MMKFEVRKSWRHPSNSAFPPDDSAEFWNNIGERVDRGRAPAALYRVGGKARDAEAVDHLSETLARWLHIHANNSCGDRCPAAIADDDGLVKIELTRAGQAAGFLSVTWGRDDEGAE